MVSTELAVEARSLEKRFGRRWAVRGVDLEVPAGSAFGLVGPNGAGKTTFIKLLLGIVHPTSGQSRLFGQLPSRAPSRRPVGYLPERLALPDTRSPTTHLSFLSRLIGAPPSGIEARLEEVGLDRSAWRLKMKGFSKGMKQRVGLACALLGEPRLLILDEPTDGIDPMGRIHIRELLLERVKAGTTVFLNSHLLAETERLCDHVAILGAGKVLAAGTLEELRRRGAPTARFAPRDDVETIAARHGLVAGPAGYVVEGDASPEAMSRALAKAINDGLVLVQLETPTDDLEAVLRQTVAEAENAA